MLSQGISQIPPDPSFKLTELYNADSSDRKVNLGQGIYKTNEGQPYVFRAVKVAKQRLLDSYHEYLPILGLPAFRDESKKLIFGKESTAIMEGKIACSQALSGTGSLHLAGAFLRRVSQSSSTVYITEPSWSNHRAVFESVGFPVKAYNYLDAAGKFDAQSLFETLDGASSGSIFVFHASAHNPSGQDPTRDQWKQICETMEKKNIFPLFDAAYLGLTSGDFENDVWPIRYFAQRGLELAVCLSFAKMMGLYGERIGALAFQTKSPKETAIVESHLEHLMRAEISNPPAFGARVVAEVLRDPKLEASWRVDLKEMSLRLESIRQRLHGELKKLGCPKNFDSVIESVGMFAILGLDKAQVRVLRDEYHIFMADSSRISIAGMNDSNVAYVAQSINELCSVS